MRRAFAIALALVCASASAQRQRAVRGWTPPPPTLTTNAEPASCAATPLAPVTCADGGVPGASLAASEVDAIIRAAARSLSDNSMTIAVVDRAGRILGVFRKPGANPANDDLAVGVARTGAFFSHNQAPLSSRTVRFLSGIHFPPGIINTPSAALYGIENTNRGCDFNVTFNDGGAQCIPRARRLGGTRCDPFDTSGCGPGIVTGKVLPNDADQSSVNAGGIPLYRVQVDGARVVAGQLLGGIGVVGISDPQRAEYAAASGAFGSVSTGIVPVPFYPVPHPGNVFIDGIRLPFLGPDLRLNFAMSGLPNGVRLEGTTPGTDAGTYLLAPRNGGCAANEYLVGPIGSALGNLSAIDVDAIVRRAVDTARRTRAAIRLPLNRYTRMVIAVADTDGSILALHRMPDATVFSVDVAVAKSRNVVWFSQHGIGSAVPPNTAVSNRTIGFGAQPFYPSGIDSDVFDPTPGPWYQSLFVNDLTNPCSQGDQPKNANQSGIIFFAGSTPLYRGDQLVGGLGVSGDGIEQDDYVTFYGAGPFLPPQNLWADQLIVNGARLPMFKFPRHPEGVEE